MRPADAPRLVAIVALYLSLWAVESAHRAGRALAATSNRELVLAAFLCTCAQATGAWMVYLVFRAILYPLLP